MAFPSLDGNFSRSLCGQWCAEVLSCQDKLGVVLCSIKQLRLGARLGFAMSICNLSNQETVISVRRRRCLSRLHDESSKLTLLVVSYYIACGAVVDVGCCLGLEGAGISRRGSRSLSVSIVGAKSGSQAGQKALQCEETWWEILDELV